MANIGRIPAQICANGGANKGLKKEALKSLIWVSDWKRLMIWLIRVSETKKNHSLFNFVHANESWENKLMIIDPNYPLITIAGFRGFFVCVPSGSWHATLSDGDGELCRIFTSFLSLLRSLSASQHGLSLEQKTTTNHPFLTTESYDNDVEWNSIIYGDEIIKKSWFRMSKKATSGKQLLKNTIRSTDAQNKVRKWVPVVFLEQTRLLQMFLHYCNLLLINTSWQLR